MFHTIQSDEDIRYFLEKTNSLHDGHILEARYEHNGITKTENGHRIYPAKTKLILKILVTSIWDAVVDLEFECLSEWQIKGDGLNMISTTVMFSKNKQIVWTDDAYVTMENLKKGSYIIAGSMKWRITEQELTCEN